MTFTEAAAHVLRLVGKPLHYKEITDVAIERGLLSHVGKSPEVTMGARLAAQVKKSSKDNPIARVKPGVFALSEWDEKVVEDGLADRTPAIDRMRAAEAANGGGSEEEGESAPREIISSPIASHRKLDDDTPPDEEEQRRRELSAAATELFESEDDDDQPIFGGPEPEVESSDAGEGREGKRRRRRRRGRTRRDEEPSDDGGDDLPTYTVSDAEPADYSEPEESFNDYESGDGEVDGSVATMIESALSRYDRGKGPVAAQNIADSLRRKLGSDASLNAAALLAVVQADNYASELSGRPPRFRISGNKIALSSWTLDKRTLEKQRALARAAEQLRESTARSLSEELKRLPQRAFGELVMVLLGRLGMTDLSVVRRPGAHGSELHLSGTLAAGGLDPKTGGAIRVPTAVMIRRDGKDIGRERVTELRGALHHYGPAAQGWLISGGQVLSGAREEAQSVGASPVVLSGRAELADLCLVYGVGVRPHRIEIPFIDVELFEGLHGR